MAQDWDIKPRAEACGQCHTPFVDRHPYFSCLVFGADGYARTDFCDSCWNMRPKSPTSGLSAWQGVFRAPPPPEEEALKKETAETLLRKLIEEQNPARQQVIFILAVMLERKKLLIERDVKVQDGVTTRVYEHRHSGETFVIHDPHLNLNELGAVQAEVVELLGARKKKGDGGEAKGAAEAEESASGGSGVPATAEEIPDEPIATPRKRKSPAKTLTLAEIPGPEDADGDQDEDESDAEPATKVESSEDADEDADEFDDDDEDDEDDDEDDSDSSDDEDEN